MYHSQVVTFLNDQYLMPSAFYSVQISEAKKEADVARMTVITNSCNYAMLCSHFASSRIRSILHKSFYFAKTCCASCSCFWFFFGGVFFGNTTLRPETKLTCK